MSSLIHPSAIIDPSARLGENVEVGPYSVIGAGVEIGNGTRIAPHVVVEANSIIGQNCKIASGAILGGLPQDIGFKGEFSRIRIGDGTHIRECVTVNRATGEGKETAIGDNCMLMAYSHVGHNCQLANNVILANSVQLGGYVEIGEYAFIGGASAIHQFVHIGRMVIIAGLSGSRQDIPPL